MAFQPFDLTGKVALITGGNSGIGLGMATGLAQAGADICIWGTNPAKNEAALAALAAHGTRVHGLLCDVGDEAAVARAFAEILEVMGRVDGCFANAATGHRGVPFEAIETADWQHIVNVNLNGAFYTFRAAARHMKARAAAGDPGGRLIGTASLAAVSGQARGEHYAATKGAMVSMVKALAVEYARHGITAHALLPGWIETPMTDAALTNDKFIAGVMPRIPMRRWGTGADFAGIAIYLMSDASAYHTADTFIIDGGYYAF